MSLPGYNLARMASIDSGLGGLCVAVGLSDAVAVGMADGVEVMVGSEVAEGVAVGAEVAEGSEVVGSSGSAVATGGGTVGEASAQAAVTNITDSQRPNFPIMIDLAFRADYTVW